MKYYVLSTPLDGKYISGEVKFSPTVQFYRSLDPTIFPKQVEITVLLWPRARAIKVDFFCPSVGFFVSEKVAKVLSEFTADGELLPAKIFFHNGELVNEKYFFWHIKNRLDAFDSYASQYKEKRKNKNHIATDTNPATNIEKLVLNEAVVAGIDVFHLQSVGFYAPIVSENIYNKLVHLKLKNILLTPVDTYRDPY